MRKGLLTDLSITMRWMHLISGTLLLILIGRNGRRTWLSSLPSIAESSSTSHSAALGHSRMAESRTIGVRCIASSKYKQGFSVRNPFIQMYIYVLYVSPVLYVRLYGCMR